MTTAIATKQDIGAQIERVIVNGDLSALTPEQRVSYYNAVCESVGLNPLTRPFEYITLNGKLTLYARRDCTDQLRKIHGVSINIAARELVEDVYVVTAKATDRHGRQDDSIGAVPLAGLKGEPRANAMMKAETKAKRRVTLSICGLGMLDENEVASIPGATFPAQGLVGPAAPPIWTAGTENVAKREPIRGFADEPGEDDPMLTSAHGDLVDIIEPKTGEVLRREPRCTSGQIARIHATLRDISTSYPDARYRSDLKASFCKEHANELSIREAGRVIDRLDRRRAKVAPELEAQAADSAAARAERGITPTREPGQDDE